MSASFLSARPVARKTSVTHFNRGLWNTSHDAITQRNDVNDREI